MNLLDGFLVLVLASTMIGAWRLGLIARLASWLGIGLGFFIALRVAPSAVRTLGTNDPMTRVFITALMFIGLAGVGAVVGEVVGLTVRKALPLGGFRTLDRVGGAAFGALIAMIGFWLMLPVLAEVPGSVARQVRTSTLAATIYRVAPDPPDALQTLRGLVSTSGFPQVFADLREAPDTGPPPAAAGMDQAVVARVAASTVRVTGRGCGGLQEGSGFTPRADLVVTNAHVVAGTSNITVLRPDGQELAATPVLFDPNRDLALLRVPGLSQQPLPVADGKIGDVGAVFGHPGGQTQLEVSPARVTDEREARGRDIYGRNTTLRYLFFLASRLAPGDSGGALVNNSGDVIGVAFAISPDRAATAYALTHVELRAVLGQATSGAVGTGGCTR
ncbi:MAG: MarP family serine protease [Acidimicrobiales bacterium]